MIAAIIILSAILAFVVWLLFGAMGQSIEHLEKVLEKQNELNKCREEREKTCSEYRRLYEGAKFLYDHSEPDVKQQALELYDVHFFND